MNRLQNKNVLLTGATGGIGQAVLHQLLDCGANVIITGRDGEKLRQLAAAAPQRVQTFAGDLTEAATRSALLAVCMQRGGIDVLINNAGLGGTCRLVDMQDEAWDRVIDISLTGTMRMMRAMLRYMQPRGRGVIVNNASVLGWRAQVEQCHYAAAKAGVMALTRCAAMESAQFGVRINAVSPSIAMHDFLRKTTSPELLAELSKREAFGRPAEVWEVANVMMFLASDYASYMTGEVVSVSSQHP